MMVTIFLFQNLCWYDYLWIFPQNCKIKTSEQVGAHFE